MPMISLRAVLVPIVFVVSSLAIGNLGWAVWDGVDYALQIGDVVRHAIYPTPHGLFNSTMPIYNGSLSLNYSAESLDFTQSVIHKLLEDEEYEAELKSIRSVHVFCEDSHWDAYKKPPPSGRQIRKKWKPLAALIPRFFDLKGLTFECKEQFPLILLDPLHDKQPLTHLHIRDWTRPRADMRVGDKAEEALARSPSLRSIHAHFITGGPGIDLRDAAFGRIMALSPNLESVERTTEALGGCVIYPLSTWETYKQRWFESAFKVKKPVQKTLKQIRWEEVDLETLEEWSRFTDLSRLESLLGVTPSVDFITYALETKAFRSLKHLSVQVPYAPQHSDELGILVDEFLASLDSLESLSITNRGDTVRLDTILNHHGPSLRTLALHEVEYPDTDRVALFPEEISLVNMSCPELATFEFDINRTSSGELESRIYSSLSDFPKLTRVTIHMDSDLRNLDRLEPGRPNTVDRAFAEKIWHSIQDNKIGAALEELILYIGEPDRDVGFGYPAFWVLDERTYRQRFHVKRSEMEKH